MSRRIFPGPGPRRAHLVIVVLLAALAIVVGFVVASRPDGPHPGTAPSPTPWPCMTGGR